MSTAEREPTSSRSRRTAELDADELEPILRDELTRVSLVGEIDLDRWGPAAEAALRPKAAIHDPVKLGRILPACFATYLTFEGLHEYEEATFWRNVSIPELRIGQQSGPAFEEALHRVGLPTFDDLEANEGFDKHTRGRYIRRIHLHGGLPRTSVVPVLELLASTLRSGARSASDVAAEWASLDLFGLVRSKAAERLFAYTGDFGVQLLGHLIDLLRAADRGGNLSLAGVPTYLVDGVFDFLNRTERTLPPYTPGPRIRIDPARLGPPRLVVPAGAAERWCVDGREVGWSSRQSEDTFALHPPGTASHWVVTTNEGGHEHRFVSESVTTPIFVFDERGRFHPRGTSLGGWTAFVVCPRPTTASATTDAVDLDRVWSDFQILVCDLRGESQLRIQPQAGAEVCIEVSSGFEVELDGDRIEGMESVDGLPVFGTSATLVFPRFVPDPDSVTVTVDGRTTRLGRLDERDGAFDLTALLPNEPTPVAHVSVSRGDNRQDFSLCRIPGLALHRPRLAAPHGDVDVQLRTDDGKRTSPITFPEGATTRTVRLDAGAVTIGMRLTLDRLAWSVRRPSTGLSIADDAPFALRLDELPDAELDLRTAGTPVRVMLRGADAIHEEWARRDPRDPQMSVVRLRRFAETVRGASAPRLTVHVVTGPDEAPIDIGTIESRFEPWNVRADLTEWGDAAAIEVSWDELQSWPDRAVRIWHGDSHELVATHPVPDGERSVRIELDDPRTGRHLVEVAAKAGWATPRFPDVGPSVVSLWIGSPTAARLREAVLAGDRRARFTDDELDDLVDLLSDLVLEVIPQPNSTDAHIALLERIADVPERAISVMDELADRLAIDDEGNGRDALEPLLVELLPLLFDFPIRDADQRTGVRLEHLWVTAPIAAACLDAGADEATRRRWKTATGFSATGVSDVSKSLDRLAEALPRRSEMPPAKAATTWVDPRVQPVTVVGPDLLLGTAAWTAALDGLYRTAATTSAASTAPPVQRLVDDLTRRPPDATAPRWSRIPRRIHDRVAYLGLDPRWMSDLVTLSCAHLDPGGAIQADGTDRSADVLAALLMIQRINRDAVRGALLYAAASLRILEQAGSLAALME